MNKKSVTVSVPGKVILSGDHAVVYGRPALVGAIDRRMRVQVPSSKFQVPNKNPYIQHCIGLVQDKYRIKKQDFNISVESEIPEGYHLGSSAALSVGVIGALTYYVKNIWNPQSINQMAYEAEKVMHGTPSGVDNTAVAMGGLIWYRKELEFLKSMWQLPIKISAGLNNFYLIDTGKPAETTGEMVSCVRSAFSVKRLAFEKIFNENEIQTKRMAVALKDKNEGELMDAISGSSRTLVDMGVVSDIAGSIVRTIELSGGAAKILGGGGKKGPVGYLLCYHPDREKLGAVCKKLGLPFFPVVLGAEGVKLEK